MKGVSIIHSPWIEEFKVLLSESEKIDFTSPFIKTHVINEIIESGLKVRGVTVFNIPRFTKGASDIEAVEKLILFNADLRSFGPLHAKIYIFDNTAIVTSANLTESGLTRNEEYGVLIRNEELLEEIIRDFESIFRNSSKIQNQWIRFAKKVIDCTSPEQKKLSHEFDREVIPDKEMVAKSLTGWMREVYLVVQSLSDEIFNLQEMYGHINHFSKIYPNNQHIEEKIRQTLQSLRDIGLIEFLDNRGNYRVRS
jgi:phosphatidylserine/phosphatidylglycerophosphate/cardiolipin synthase-like enzyme